MHAERDHLRNHVFPVLEERLRERFHHIELVDLRLGVKPGSIEDQRDQQLLVLKVCLGEIERSRPFLIALLGDHYGWIPPADRMRDAAREAGHRGNVSGRSITALEIEYGIQDNHDQKKRTWFYFRNPLPYNSMDSHTAALYSDEYSHESSVAGCYQRMTELKERITREMPDRVRTYEAGWDTAKKEVTNLDEWGWQVIEDLWGDLEEETRGLAQAQPNTWQEQESRVIGQFLETHCRELLGRDEELGKLRGIALGSGPELGVCVLGPPGSGKSALMAALARSLRDDDVLLLTHFTGISSRSTQVDSLLERWTGELAAALGQTDPSPSLLGRQQRQKAFAELLSQAAVRRRVVCLVDALNQFESTQAAQYLTWLPELWPLNARLLATTLPGTAAIALAKRRSVETLDLRPLDAASATAIARSVSDRYHTHLPDEIPRALLSHQLPDGGLAAGNPLWLELALQELMLLDGDDFSRAEKSYDGEAQEKLDALRLDIAWQLPAEIESLYQAMFRRAEKVHDSSGTQWAHGLSALLAASRTGWRESDFEALLPELAGDGWTNLRFAALRRTFRAHLVQRGASAQWDFFHAQARATAERWALSDSEARKLLHLAIARHLELLPADDPLRQTETMVHLIGAQDHLLAARYYSSDLDPGELAGATQALAGLCLRDPEAGLAWYRGMLNHPVLEDDPAFELSHRCVFELHDALEDDAQVEDRIALLEAGRQRLEGLRQRAPNYAWYARVLSVSYSRLADLYVSLGKLTTAQEHYRRSLAILEEWRQRDPDGAEFTRGLSVDNLHLSDLYVSLGDPTRALEHCRRSVALLEELRQKAPDNAECTRDFSMSYTKLGDLFVRLGESTRALEHYRQSLTIFEELRQKAPDNAEPARNLSVSHSKLGDLCVKLGESAQALEHYRQSLAILHELRQRAPDHAQYAHDHFMLCIRLGDLYVKLADLPQALEHYRQSLAISEELRQRVPDNAENARDLAGSHACLGGLYMSLGKWTLALEHYRQSLTIREDLRQRSPDNAEYARDLSGSYTDLGDLYLVSGELLRASEHYRQALPIVEELWKRGPDSAEYERDLYRIDIRLGDSYVRQGDATRAYEHYRQSLAISVHLLQRSPDNAEYKGDLAMSYSKLGDLYARFGELAEGLEFYHQSKAVREELRQRAPESAECVRDLSVDYSHLGDLYVRLGEPVQAREHYHRSLAIFEELRQRAPDSAKYARDLVISLQSLASFCAEQGDKGPALHHLEKCHRVLLEMKTAGMFLDPPLVELLDRLSRQEGLA